METPWHARGANAGAEENLLRININRSADQHDRERDNGATMLPLHSGILDGTLHAKKVFYHDAILTGSSRDIDTRRHAGMFACGHAVEALGPKCTQEQIVVTWHATITRGNSVTSPLLTTTLTQNNVDRAQFDALRQALTAGGGAGTYNVTWTIPAFYVNGGYIALAHGRLTATD
jgi:hypothetical protein